MRQFDHTGRGTFVCRECGQTVRIDPFTRLDGWVLLLQHHLLTECEGPSPESVPSASADPSSSTEGR